MHLSVYLGNEKLLKTKTMLLSRFDLDVDGRLI